MPKRAESSRFKWTGSPGGASEGADAWFNSPPARFLGNDRNPDDYQQIRDIVEVWFESGSSHAFVLEARPELAWPASLYLEGSDQHRGWFHSSLLAVLRMKLC